MAAKQKQLVKMTCKFSLQSYSQVVLEVNGHKNHFYRTINTIIKV